MSTNVKIDLVLLRLQEQALDTAQQNRQDRLNREEAAELNRLTQKGYKLQESDVIDLARQLGISSMALLQFLSVEIANNTDSYLLDLLTERAFSKEQNEGRSKSTYQFKRPAAQRLTTKGVVGVQWRIVNGALEIGPPGLQVSATAELDVLNYGTQPPEFWMPIIGQSSDRSSGALSDLILLPITNTTCIAVLYRTEVYAWYQFNATGGAFTLLASGSDSIAQTLCFVVGSEAVRQISVPTLLNSYLADIYPPMKLNATRNHTGGPFFAYPGFTPTPISVFDATLWGQSKRYGSYYFDADTLARHFGMGYLTAGHRGGSSQASFYTPAIYRYLTGPMTIDSNARNYAYMRENYYPMAPTSYIGPCQIRVGTLITDGASSYTEYTYPSCNAEHVGFDATSEVPVDIYTPMDPERFTRREAYDVELNGANRFTDSIVYAWNWDKRSYCKQQLAALGFTPEDLKP